MDMDVEKTMRSMLEMQARHEAWLQKHEEAIRRHDEEFSRLNASMATASDLIGRLAQAETRLVERMDSGFRELREAQAATECKLTALIDTVDKLARRNGHDFPAA